jgi:hypothetical protein
MSTPDEIATLLGLIPEELYNRLLAANGCTGELSHELKVELADVSATLKAGKRKVRKHWSDPTKEVFRKWRAEHDLTNRRPGSLTNAERQKRYRQGLKARARMNSTALSDAQHEGVARLKEALEKYCPSSFKGQGSNYSKPYGVALLSMLQSDAAHFVIARRLIDLVEGRDRDGWSPETNEAFARYCKDQVEPVRQKILEDKVTRVNFRDLGA